MPPSRSRSASPVRCSAGESRIAPSTCGHVAPFHRASSVPNDQPRSHSRGSPAARDASIAAATSWCSGLAVARTPLAGSLLGCGAAGVEPEHREIGQRGQPVRRALRSTWLSIIRRPWAADGGRSAWRREPGPRAGQLADQVQPSAVRSVSGSDGRQTVLARISVIAVSPAASSPVCPPAGSRAGGRRCQHELCQCRRSAGPGDWPGHTTTCGTPARISWSQARAPVGLRGRGARHRADHPLPVRPGLGSAPARA